MENKVLRCNKTFRSDWDCHIGYSGVTGGGQGAVCPPETCDREIFADVSGKNREGKKGKGVQIDKKRRKMVKGRLKIGKGSRKSSKKIWRLFFFFFLFFFLPFTFENDRNLFWVYQNGKFSTGKKHFTPGKNQEKWLCPLRKICLLRPWLVSSTWTHIPCDIITR